MSAGDLNDAPQRLEDAQLAGTQPDRNVWLSASAGTGKTSVLTARVLRLLLQGVRPEAILGLTFTKAGAAEMAQRVRGTLARWVQLKEELKHHLYAIGAERHDDPAMLDKARALFAEVIDAPAPGLTFQTIHSFCQSLLGAFPLESGLLPGFTLVDERDAKVMRRQLLSDLTDRATRDGNLPFLDALSAASYSMDSDTLLNFLERCSTHANSLVKLDADIFSWLCDAFALPRSTPQTFLAAQCADDAVDMAGWRALAAKFAGWKTKTGDEAVAKIGHWLSVEPQERSVLLGELLLLCFTKDGEMRSEFKAGKKLQDAADLAERLGRWAEAGQRTATQLAAVERVATALQAGRFFAAAWIDVKRRLGLVDYDDLIRHTVELLSDDGRAAWIRYKLDQQIDHILVDEAQDTNLDQWRIVRALTEEFFAGKGARDDVVRTLFVVGDYKQAIYGFQGTDPRHFAHEEGRYRALGLAADAAFEQVDLITNFRSTKPVLAAVDKVIEALDPQKLGLPAGEPVLHRTPETRNSTPGRVTLWPAEPAAANMAADDADEGEESWIDDATRRLADRIAAQVRDWIDHGLDGAPVSAKDVMILVRTRKELAALLVARLQARGVPVAGVDRLRLARPLAVQDLMAAIRFVLQPRDDLNLASLLVSPLIGFSQDELWHFGAGRKKRSLWGHLREQPALAPRLAPLRDMLAMADFVTPHAFLEQLLSGPLQGRAKLLARLGSSARDPMEELLSAALELGVREGASLHRFVEWFDSGDVEIKRETNVDGDEARVLTVHGSKGLEAPIVILADATANPDAKQDRKGFDWKPREQLTIPLPVIKKEERPETLAEAMVAKAAREEEEHWRLLYVAMTRAKRHLFVTGALGVRDKGEPAVNSWYARIDAAMGLLGTIWVEEEGAARWPQHRTFPAKPVQARSVQASAGKVRREGNASASAVTIPDWAQTAPLPEARPPRPLSPSRQEDVNDVAVPVRPSSDARSTQRGILMHALFERLPAVAPTARLAAAQRWLAEQASGFDAADQAAMATAVIAVLDDARFASAFGEGSLAEVPFSALVEGRVIAGAIDRLRVTAEGIDIVDFKTGAFVPADADDVPRAYVRQMAAYAEALRAIYPGRPVRAALLYTAGPRWIELPEALLQAHSLVAPAA